MLAPSITTSQAETAGKITQCGFSAQIQFREGAPRDRFSISNTSSDQWNVTHAALDLSSSVGNLIFDVTEEGLGVEVFQPFRREPGSASLIKEPVVKDGDQTITMSFNRFSPGDNFTFSIDVDDQLLDSDLGQIRVAGSEIEGAGLSLTVESGTGDSTLLSGVFDDQSQIIFDSGACPDSQ